MTDRSARRRRSAVAEVAKAIRTVCQTVWRCCTAWKGSNASVFLLPVSMSVIPAIVSLPKEFPDPIPKGAVLHAYTQGCPTTFHNRKYSAIGKNLDNLLESPPSAPKSGRWDTNGRRMQ
jgi:hypothetical protein